MRRLSVFSPIGEAWKFYRKQPILNAALLWLLVLPSIGLTELSVLQEEHPYFQMLKEKGIAHVTDLRLFLLVFAADTALSLLLLWGIACVLLVGKRLILKRAGRVRRSFKTVRTEAAGYLIPLLFTSILRGCFTFFWSLLLIIPGILYYLRTAFYPIAIVAEDCSFRDALTRSKEVTKGRLIGAISVQIVIGLILFVPASLIDAILQILLQPLHPNMIFVLPVLSALLFAFPLMLMLLATTVVYGRLKLSR
ncbi:TPA: hypothetical protein DCL30_01640 [Candidatus Peribacteria bacterium]|nr:MAG: hypothetical protein A3J91_03325 [Candidatus Peribacteria bacterium RIFOXYC2_FULL_58_10]OGJ85327.1 MAG: hypothetical protein A2529_02585 [Candidatus Peribacteria bacterium RIFOXYD2_FULL_58_15]HAI98228.1 hypothetical protein [Candidatus Peribacteria bacterium]HAS34490.1 hypothetical protein [Candidatus Peribacteria bacterium]